MKHNFPKDTYIICNKKLNLLEVNEILKLSVDTNVPVYSQCFREKINKEFPYFCWDKEEIVQTKRIQKNNPNDIFVSLEEFKAFFIGKGKYIASFEEELKLNSKYTAIVTKQNIRVGCQEFTHQQIKDLYNLSQKAQKAKN